MERVVDVGDLFLFCFQCLQFGFCLAAVLETAVLETAVLETADFAVKGAGCPFRSRSVAASLIMAGMVFT